MYRPMIAAYLFVLAAGVFSGRENQLHVPAPRLDAPAAIITVDGVLDEGSGNRGGALFGALESGREVTDLTPDYVYQSKGRLTDYGYEIEIAIPFKTLRFPAGRTQSWALNVSRRVQSDGLEDTWT